MEPFVKTFQNDTEFFSSYNPELIEKKLVKYIEDVLDTTPVVSHKKFKISFEQKTVEDIENGDEIDMELKTGIQVRILKVDDKKVCVRFQKWQLEGHEYNQSYFNQLYLNYKNEVLQVFNNLTN